MQKNTRAIFELNGTKGIIGISAESLGKRRKPFVFAAALERNFLF